MYELPLFPLDSVLFPGTPISLHIFEERYKLMMNRCIETRQPFGVVLIKRDQETSDAAAEPHEIGCSAEIQQVQMLSEGRMNLVAMGHERFRIVSLNHDEPYLVGVVEPLPFPDDGDLIKAEAGLRPLVNEYLEILARVGKLEIDTGFLPADPLNLGYMAASLLQVPTAQKQTLLATPNTGQFMRVAQHMYKQEVTLLQTMPLDSFGPFSIN